MFYDCYVFSYFQFSFALGIICSKAISNLLKKSFCPVWATDKKPREAVHRRAVRQTDGEDRNETANGWAGKDRPEPTPWEVQGLVLPVYTLQEGDVAPENEWDPLIHRE